MTTITPTLKLFTSEVDHAGIQISSFILEHQGNNYHFPARAGDIIHLFTQSICLYVLTINRAESHIALFAFMSPESDFINSISINSAGEIRDALGPLWEKLSPRTILHHLLTRLI